MIKLSLIIISINISLQEEIKKDSTKEFNLFYNQTFDHIQNNNFVEALRSIAIAQKLSWQLGDSMKIIKTGRVKGQVFRKLNKNMEALCTFEEVLPITARNKGKGLNYLIEYADLLSGLSITHTFNGGYSKALEFGFNSLVIFESIGSKSDILNQLNNLGLIYYKLSNSDKAIDYYKKAISLSDELGGSGNPERLNINLGLSYLQKSNYQEAEKYIRKGLTLCGNNCSNDIQIEGKFSLGHCLLGMRLLDNAERYYKNSLALAIKTDNTRFQAENLLGLARIAMAKKEYSKAEYKLSSGESLAIQHKYLDILINIYKYSYELKNKTQDLKQEAIYKEKYISLNDSIFSGELIQSITRLSTSFEERENLKIITTQNKITELQKEIIKWQRFQRLLVTLIAVLFITLTLFIYINYKRKVNLELILEEKVKRRTHELETSRYELERINVEQTDLIKKAYAENRSILASTKGIYQAAVNDIKDPEALEYITKMNEITHRIEDSLTVLSKRINSIDNPKK